MESTKFILVLCVVYANASIKSGGMMNKLIKVKRVGSDVGRIFLPLTDIPPPIRPHTHSPNGRRHFENCNEKPGAKEVDEGAKVDFFGEYYDDKIAKTVANVIIPDHIDHKHFEVTTSVPYLTVGPIEAIGYHPSTMKSEHPPECEKIYQEHLADQYSDEMMDYSEESLETAQMPLFPGNDNNPPAAVDEKLNDMYGDTK